MSTTPRVRNAKAAQKKYEKENRRKKRLAELRKQHESISPVKIDFHTNPSDDE